MPAAAIILLHGLRCLPAQEHRASRTWAGLRLGSWVGADGTSLPQHPVARLHRDPLPFLPSVAPTAGKSASISRHANEGGYRCLKNLIGGVLQMALIRWINDGIFCCQVAPTTASYARAVDAPRRWVPAALPVPIQPPSRPLSPKLISAEPPPTVSRSPPRPRFIVGEDPDPG